MHASLAVSKITHDYTGNSAPELQPLSPRVAASQTWEPRACRHTAGQLWAEAWVGRSGQKDWPLGVLRPQISHPGSDLPKVTGHTHRERETELRPRECVPQLPGEGRKGLQPLQPQPVCQGVRHLDSNPAYLHDFFPSP